mgnify:CR=1 FL=1
MRMIRGIFYILLFYFIGECISHLTYGFIPGSIIGMILLFLFLRYKKIKEEDVEGVANAFTKNMAVFFIPAGAALLGASDMLSKFWLSIIIVCTFSSLLVISAVALVQEKMEKPTKKAKS